MDEPDEPGEFVIWRGELGWGFVAVLCLVLVVLGVNHALRLQAGAVSWFGMGETWVHMAPGILRTPLSTNVVSNGFKLSVPMPVRAGQEIVLWYNLNSAEQSASAPHASVLVSCICYATNWRHEQILPGIGELTVRAPVSSVYRMTIWQSAGPKGELSNGSFRWGVRSARD